MTFFPAISSAATTAGSDVKQNLPINDGMENTSKVTSLSTGTVSLTQDRVSGSYAVQVEAGDQPNQDYAGYMLTASNPFDIFQYSQVKVWVKPGNGAKWIKFYTNSALVKNDKDGDGEFEVGQDLISGKWNVVTLDLTRTSNPGMTTGQNLSVNTNELSTWTFDEITSVYTPVTTISPSQMVDGQTQLVNGELQFKPNGTGGYNTTPAVLVSNSATKSTFSRNSVAYKKDGIQVANNLPRYEYSHLPSPRWQDLFDTNTLAQYTSFSSATWSINGGVLTSTGPGANAGLIKKDLAFQDYEIEVTSDTAHHGGIIARYQDANNYYNILLQDDNGTRPGSNIEVWKIVNGVATNIIGYPTAVAARTLR